MSFPRKRESIGVEVDSRLRGNDSSNRVRDMKRLRSPKRLKLCLGFSGQHLILLPQMNTRFS